MADAEMTSDRNQKEEWQFAEKEARIALKWLSCATKHIKAIGAADAIWCRCQGERKHARERAGCDWSADPDSFALELVQVQILGHTHCHRDRIC